MAAKRRDIRRVAVVHDWLTGMRGGEAVLESLLELFPGADLFTLLYNRGSVSELIANRKIQVSFIDRLPFKAGKYRWYLPLFPSAIEQFDFHGYDLILSSSHCVARGVVPPPFTPHLSYFHSPMRYVWDHYHQYFPPTGFANRAIIPFFANYLRMWDVSAKDRVDRYVSNSAFVAERIRRYYGKPAVVIPPPCVREVGEIQINEGREDFYLIVSAFVPYKRIDLAIEAFRDLPYKLVIVGDGPERKKLESMSPPNVSFVGRVDRDAIGKLYAAAAALIFPGEEDFGIVPVEAQARGCPVIAYRSGGALETIREGRTGLFFDEQNPAAIAAAVRESRRMRFRAPEFRRNVMRFTDAEFKRKILVEIDKLV